MRQLLRKILPHMLLIILLSVLYPAIIRPLYELIQRSLYDKDEVYIGLLNFINFFDTPGLSAAVKNSFFVTTLSTIITVILAFFLAYSVTHTRIWGKKIISSLVMLPLFAPSLLPGIGLVYLFGTQGFFKFLLGGHELYGPLGIILGLVIFALPHATLLLITSLRGINQQLYQAASALGAGELRKFITITIPNARYGIISAIFVSFTLSLGNFGVPKVLGGTYYVLATELYAQVIGQLNFGVGAVISLFLLLPTCITLLLNIWVRKAQDRLSAKKTVSHSEIRFSPLRDAVCALIAYSVTICLVAVVGVVVLASFMGFWPYDYSFGLTNYSFEDMAFGFSPLINSMKLAVSVAFFGTAFMFVGAYLSERMYPSALLSKIYRSIMLIPLGIPGMVLGLAYIFAFNRPEAMLPLYGTFILLVINTIVHFSTVAHLTCSDSLSHLDRNYEHVGRTLNVSPIVTFFKVIVPSCKMTLFDVFLYLFINAMTTLSAVVFLSAGDSMLASVMVMNVYNTGSLGYAAAMCSYIMLITGFLTCVRVMIRENKKGSI